MKVINNVPESIQSNQSVEELEESNLTVEEVQKPPAVHGQRRLGFLKGQYTLPENFDEIDRELDKEIEALMLGEDDDQENA